MYGLKPVFTPGNGLTENVTGALKLPVKLPIVSKTVAGDREEACAVTAFALAVKVKAGAAVTVTSSGTLFTRPPPDPITFTVYVPGGVLRAGVKVSALVPAPGAANEAVVKEPVMPVGKPFKESDMVELNVPMSATVANTVAVDACTTETGELASVRAKFGETASMRGTLMVWMKVPALAVTVNV
jgi:hypothetical protein